MNIDDYIKVNDIEFLKYSNIVKNSYKLTPWGDFMIKKYKYDIEKGYYSHVYTNTDFRIFHHENILPYSMKFNPEKLI